MPQQRDEGYIKFNSDWTESAPFPTEKIDCLNFWRQKLYVAKLVGAYPDGIGFGNVSQRSIENQFYISGSKSGNEEQLTKFHYAEVTDFDIDKNQVVCKGPIIASSESMSHAVIYQELADVNAVFHVHHFDLWENVLHNIPTTNVEAEYGSPEMAREIIRLIGETDVSKTRVFAMAGHREGLFSFGRTLKEAGDIILDLYYLTLG